MEQSEGVPSSKYLERHVFPVLLPGLEDTLRAAKNTERRRLFNPLDHLAAYLYRHNSRYSGRDGTALKDIPFVQDEWAVNPRSPLPLSATLSEEEAAIIVQSCYRSYQVRRDDPRAQHFRKWQKEVHKEQEAARKIQRFWRYSVTKRPAGLAEGGAGPQDVDTTEPLPSGQDGT